MFSIAISSHIVYSLYLAATIHCHPVIDSGEPSSLSKPSSITLRSDAISSTFPPKKATTKNTASAAFKALQLNLCNSGFAKCYGNGLAIGEGSSAISVTAPDIVTVNEICLNDVKKQLHPTFATAWANDYTYFVFQPAINKKENAPYKCKNGDLYGDAVIGRVAASKWKGMKGYGGIYTTQDSSNEQRTFACAAATGDHFACTTHLSTTEATALTQCKALMFDAVPYLKSLSGSSGHTVVGGDLNLKFKSGDPLSVQNCVPNGYTRKGDGSVQHITFSNDFRFEDSSKLGVLYTDHPGWMVELTRL